MTSGTNFWDANVWSFISTLTILLSAMMIANSLRNIIKPLRKLMIPSSVLGGFLILLADYIFKQIFGHSMFVISTLESLTYHGLGLGFVAMSLRNTEKPKGHKKSSDTFDTGLVVVSTYLMQAILGLIITIALFYLIGSFAASGILLPMGYGQGPGQAYNWGRIYENLYGFTNGTSFGLTVAAMGFVAASLGGIVYLNVLRRKGEFFGEIGGNVKDDHLTAETITGNNEVPLSESMDKLTIQIALMFIAYIMAYLLMRGVNAIIETGAMGDFGYNTVQPLIWGFNFLFGTICALLLKGFLKGLRKCKLVHREYTNNFMQTRVAGFMFDIMVVASIAAINLTAFQHTEFIIPLLLICTAGGVLTYLYLLPISKKIFPGYRHEAFLSLYGMLTGTASTGVILMREVDPRFETPASINLVYQQPWAILFGFPMLLLLSVAPQSIANTFLTLGVLAVLFIGMNILLFRKFIFKRKK